MFFLARAFSLLRLVRPLQNPGPMSQRRFPPHKATWNYQSIAWRRTCDTDRASFPLAWAYTTNGSEFHYLAYGNCVADAPAGASLVPPPVSSQNAMRTTLNLALRLPRLSLSVVPK